MGEVVCVLAAPHDPTLPGVLRARHAEEEVSKELRFLERQRETLAAARPDALVIIAGDHLNQWFLDNMPAFLLGKARRSRGPFPEEARAFGIPEVDLETDGDLARYLLRDGFARGIDWATSDEYLLDHAFTIPLGLLRPEHDLPIVPVFTNVLAPPLPAARRFYQLGEILRAAVEGWDQDRRVGVIVTGHLTNNVGGGRMLDFLREPISEWDRHTWSLVEAWDVERMIEEATWERLNAVGHATPAWLDVIAGFGAARGARPTATLMGGVGFGPVQPLFIWDEPTLRGERG